MLYGYLKSDYGASTPSQANPQEPVPLQTAPPIPGKVEKGSLRSKKRSFGAILDKSPKPKHGTQCLGVQDRT
ncbi:hypothetical protein PIB30_096008 [Stylosanthes scabra]|uniref:Uncharacterized protein n=1 Tax=Stylosanthes scabra TaxID=79078 RepID=A0ABU6UVC8_9FABA|nr:hypothetical protein [Stylosanthes scabra]